jgi:penicillin G amidase
MTTHLQLASSGALCQLSPFRRSAQVNQCLSLASDHLVRVCKRLRRDQSNRLRNATRDRLWQIDLWRKRGLGLLSGSFGPAYVEQDRALRSFLYRGDMAEEWAAYGEGSKASMDTFVAGINGYAARVEQDPKLLPIEFRISESKPETWKSEDVVRIRSHGLTRNLTSEVARARVACLAGLDADALRKKLEPPTEPTIPVGLNPCRFPATKPRGAPRT